MYDVITVGAATRDIFIKSPALKAVADKKMFGGRALTMPLGAKLEVSGMHFDTGGGATNAAVTFARQDLKTAVLSETGDDYSGSAIVSELKKEGIYGGFIVKKKGSMSAFSVLLHPEHGGERTILVHRGASGVLTAANIPWKKLDTKWFYISSLAGNLRLLSAFLAFAKSKNIKVAYNPGGKELASRKKLLPLLKGIDVLIVNREEAALITGVPFKNEKKIFEKWDIMSPGINVMTDGHHGVMVSDGTHIYKAGIFKEKNIVDRTGAGDAFGSGFVSALARGKDISYAIRLGSANATSKVEGVGPKYGLLTRRGFENEKRWRHLPLSSKRIRE